MQLRLPKMEHDMMYLLITRGRALSQLVFLGLELTSFLTRKPEPHLALYLQRLDQNELYFFSDLLRNLKKYSFGQDLIGPACLFFEKGSWKANELSKEERR